ncbi:hypothetical protein [Phycisphaera mikurensis]|uniref:DUF2892 domain-containing protein n=1 Tax=Phycisphaera mikurensis (strain NBRC 102666 / KCTC 22515 / FYK2301M01) TaxID=1142394 RepID=I0IGI6_PHYMF|nr:hypothetical protein [Phycisphaera mikurensis]MBB6442945.1 hypothetical protein [Phycisphaera mikurensis]BAM04374.1 hypothetical protein PSMK_22150 [Phycisphaera mikurensis NBRC 102666]
MPCNIDRTGRTRRLAIGIATLAAAVVLAMLVLAGVLDHPAWWIAVAGAAAGGAFCVVEGAIGWCAVRAMGFSTPW